MRLLLVGDVVGKPGRQMVLRAVPLLRKRLQLQLVVVNAENAAGGSGITPSIYQELIAAGVDGITLGDHIYRRNEIIPVLERESNIVKPANFPVRAPGKDCMVLTTADGTHVAVISLLGRVFMRPVDCPWTAVDRVLQSLPTDIRVILVDFHAEATSDKQLMGRYLDGRVSAVLGTHTHVATADEQIFPGGTAFQCDVGMCGAAHSILGRKIDCVLETTLSFRPTFFDVASDQVQLSGTCVEVDVMTGRALHVQRIVLTAAELARWEKEEKQGICLGEEMPRSK